MKKVFLFLASALVCVMAMTSCSKDDGAPGLTNIRVEPSTITKPVGESQQITVTKVPVDADEPVYTWTTSDASVATVSNTGLVTIAGIGSATVTVASGNISANVAVTGTVKSVEVKDTEGNSAGTYPFDNSSADTTFTLMATVDPANAGVKPEWSVDVNTVTVSASADGMSAQVTIKGAGTAIVTVDVGGVTATYIISTSSLFDSAAGYWTFDDPNNLFAATIGEDLIPVNGGYPDSYEGERREIAAADGPTADNGAVYVPMHNWIKCLHGIAPNGVDTATRVNEFTVMFDIMVPEFNYTALIQGHLNNEDEASMYFKSRGRVGQGDIGDTPDNVWEAGTWYRVIFSVKYAGEGGFYDYYLNGQPLKSNPVGPGFINNTRNSLNPAGVLFFADARNGFNDEKGDSSYDFHGVNVAGIAIWDRPLTAAEVASLGMFDVE